MRGGVSRWEMGLMLGFGRKVGIGWCRWFVCRVVEWSDCGHEFGRYYILCDPSHFLREGLAVVCKSQGQYVMTLSVRMVSLSLHSKKFKIREFSPRL